MSQHDCSLVAVTAMSKGQALDLCQHGIVAAWLQPFDAAAIHHDAHLLQLHRLLWVWPLQHQSYERLHSLLITRILIERPRVSLNPYPVLPQMPACKKPHACLHATNHSMQKISAGRAGALPAACMCSTKKVRVCRSSVGACLGAELQNAVDVVHARSLHFADTELAARVPGERIVRLVRWLHRPGVGAQ